MARNKFNVDENLEEEFNVDYLKRIMKYVVPYKKDMLITVIIMFIASFANQIGVYLVKDALDSRIPNADVKGLILLASIFLFTLIINGVCLKFKIRIMSTVGQKIIYYLRKDLFAHLQKLPFNYYDSRPHGKILIRVVNYINSLSDLLSNGIINAITEIFTLFVIIGFMLSLNVKLTLVCLTGLPVLLVAIFVLKNIQRKAWQLVSSKSANLNAYVHESITGVKVTQSFCREEENLKIFNGLNTEYKTSWLKCVSMQFLIGPIVDNISLIVIVAIYVLGLTKFSAGVTVGVLIAFMGYIGRFWGPIANLANIYNSVLNAMAYLERILETLDEKPDIVDLPYATEMPSIIGEIEFKDVNFKYAESHRILNEVSFKTKPGNCVALVGPTGAGKTTIINLISRFYDLESGELLIDGVNIKDVTLNSLRKQMGVMLQDSFIFSGTILDNIRYGKLDASDEEVEAAATAVNAHDFIMGLKDGYRTQVNERGSRLSVGQRQLISFARALLADPKILILDEATSSIDTNTEILLQEGLAKLLKGRTSFIIAHRLSTIKNADTIMYIDKGCIAEKGSHEELIRKKGLYYNLCLSQYTH